MKKVIHKYQLCHRGKIVIEMPFGATPLSVSNQRGNIVLWASVDPTEPPVPYAFVAAYTGDEVPDGHLIGTTMSEGGAFVSHVYKLPTCHP